MIQQLVDQIDKTDIESLITAKVSERRTLDYKQQLPGGSSDDRREFLYDVSSFANTLGGDLVFGVTDERDATGKPTGIPGSATGLSNVTISNEIARLENLIRDAVDPRIQGIQWRIVDGFSAGPVLVMRVPKSLFGPHMVAFGGMARFYARNSTGKYPMDVREIRSAFVESTALGDRFRSLRDGRLVKILEGETPLQRLMAAKVVLHLVPLSSLGSTITLDVTRNAARLESLLRPIKGSSWGGRYNFDGFLVESAGRESYVQVFRTGLIEAAAIPFAHIPEQYKNQIPGIDLEKTIGERLALYLRAQRQLKIATPIFVAISLLGVKNYIMSVTPFSTQGHPIDRDDLRLPEFLLEDYDANLAGLLRPTFDALWQACGHEKSLNYDDDGNWRPYRS